MPRDDPSRGVARAIIAGVDYATGTGYEQESAAFLAAIRASARCAPVTLAAVDALVTTVADGTIRSTVQGTNP